jgi:hypothetical protein
VAKRALIVARPAAARDFKDVLARYAEEPKPAHNGRRGRH